MRKTYLVAGAIAVVILIWLYSGQSGTEPVRHASLADQNRESANKRADSIPTKVRVRTIDAVEQVRSVTVRGKTENKRTVQIKVETPGRIIERFVDRGTPVEGGDLLCEISMEDRQASLVEAREALNQARIDYDGALRLKQKGFNSESAIAAAKARLAATEAQLSRRELDIEKTRVRAPFAGVVEDVHQEVGAYVMPGDPCATIVDLDPMLLVGRVSEKMVHDLTVGTAANGILNDGRRVGGTLTFVGQQSDPRTRTYAIEVEVANPDALLRSGITTKIDIPVESVLAQKVSSALFSLDDAGDIGIRTINADNIVEYHNVAVLQDAEDGIWVTGLPNRATIITVGHQLVVEGERVDPVYDLAEPEKATADTPPPVSDPQSGAPRVEFSDIGQ